MLKVIVIYPYIKEIYILINKTICLYRERKDLKMKDIKNIEFYKTDIKEQESNILVDYENKKVTFYTSRKTIFYRMLQRLGKPTNTYFIGKQITGGSWLFDFKDKRTNIVFSKTLLIGQL